MSVSINNLLKLPSLREAEVIAGFNGLDRAITSITVLENHDPKLFMNYKICRNELFRNELVITGFINSRNNVERQLASVKKLDEDGVAGIILYYVGISLKKIDKKIIKLANQLDLPLICMPKNRIDLRYSDVICEVMESVVKQQINETYFAFNMMERISLLDKSKRNLDSVLMMLRNRTKCSIYLTDSSGNILNYETWPRNADFPFKKISTRHMKSLKSKDKFSLKKYCIDNVDYNVVTSHVIDETGIRLNLFTLREIDEVSINVSKQINEVIQTFINIWSPKHGVIDSSELIHSIIKDEPVKMRRIAEILKVDVSSLSTMWLFSRKLDEEDMSRMRSRMKIYADNFVLGNYDGKTIAMLSKHADNDMKLAKEICGDCEDYKETFIVAVSTNLNNASEVKEAYGIVDRRLKEGIKIYPDKTYLTLSELKLVDNIAQVISRGEKEIIQQTQILDLLNLDINGHELLDTLETYVLDSNMDYNRTAELQYLHANTVKYRLKKIKKLYGYNIFKFPEVNELYCALALRRFIEKSKN